MFPFLVFNNGTNKPPLIPSKKQPTKVDPKANQMEFIGVKETPKLIKLI
jgi:hypothetical protein